MAKYVVRRLVLQLLPVSFSRAAEMDLRCFASKYHQLADVLHVPMHAVLLVIVMVARFLEM